MASTPVQSRPWYTYLLAAVAWVASFLLGLYAIYNLLEISIGIYIRAGGGNKWETGVLRYVSVFIGAIVWLGMIIFSGEYTLKHAGDKKSWKMFAWMLGVEMVIILLGWLLS